MIYVMICHNIFWRLRAVIAPAPSQQLVFIGFRQLGRAPTLSRMRQGGWRGNQRRRIPSAGYFFFGNRSGIPAGLANHRSCVGMGVMVEVHGITRGPTLNISEVTFCCCGEGYFLRNIYSVERNARYIF